MNIKPENLWSLEAEAAVLGSMIVDPKCIGDVLPLIDEKSFFEDSHKTIFNSLVTLFIANVPVDAISLRADLKSMNQLEKIGGVEYLKQVMESVPHSANALYYARIVKERQKYRELVTIADKIQAVPNEPISVDEQMERIQALALSLEQDKSKAEYFTFAEDVERIAAEVQEQQAYISTGLRNIDNIISGVSPGELIILAGRPSMGKSALALNFVLNMAGAGLSIIIFTLEMTHRGLIKRVL